VAGEYGFGAPDDGRFEAPAERFGFSGTAPVFRAETLHRIGAFAPRFFAYNEDTDWCLRARLAGLRIMYEPAATVTHRLSATSGGAAAARVRHLAQRNALLCLVRNAPLPTAWNEVSARMRAGRGDPVRRELVRLLPWAAATRLAMSRHWTTRPGQIWARWAEQDMDWDRSPAAIR
jgi:GT2 family glycosyltransferase